MSPQEPAQGIMQTRDFGDSKFYKVDCECGNPDDTLTFNVEADPVCRQVIVTTWTSQKTNWWSATFSETSGVDIKHDWLWSMNYRGRHFLNEIIRRVSLTYKIAVHGYIEYEQTTIMTKQQALNYASTLVKAINDIEDYQESTSKK